jgi:hypothetical protein
MTDLIVIAVIFGAGYAASHGTRSTISQRRRKPGYFYDR